MEVDRRPRQALEQRAGRAGPGGRTGRRPIRLTSRTSGCDRPRRAPWPGPASGRRRATGCRSRSGPSRAGAATGATGSTDSPTKSGSNPTTLWPRSSSAWTSGARLAVGVDQAGLAVRAGDHREPAGRLARDQPDDRDRARRSPCGRPASGRPSARRGVDPPHLVVGRARPGAGSTRPTRTLRLVCSSARAASQAAGDAGGRERVDLRSQGRDQVVLRAARASSGPAGAGVLSVKVQRSSGFSTVCSPSRVLAGRRCRGATCP